MMKVFNERYIDNGMLDFLLKEREAGRDYVISAGHSMVTLRFSTRYLPCTIPVKWDFVQIQLNYVDWRHATGNNV